MIRQNYSVSGIAWRGWRSDVTALGSSVKGAARQNKNEKN